MIRAAIAIGSNSTRLLVAECDQKMTPLFRGREETKLFMGLGEDGFLSASAMISTAQAVERLRVCAAQMGAESVELMATSATRDAKNKQDFAALIKDLSGLDLIIIPGEEEAALAFRAVAGKEKCLVIDIGGGSTELTLGTDGYILSGVSLQLGASRLLKMQEIRFLDDAKNMCTHAKNALETSAQSIKDLLMSMGNVSLKGIGGSCTTSAAMLMKKEAHGEEVEGFRITKEQVWNLLQMLAPMSPEERAQVPGLPASRVLHMPHGLCILHSVMDFLNMDALTVSGRTNLDGYLMDYCQ